MSNDTIFRAVARYTREEVYNASLEYFGGDEIAADVFVSKYALRDPHNSETPYAELTPDDMHNRLAFELARVDVWYTHTKDRVQEFLKTAEWTFDAPTLSISYQNVSEDYADVAQTLAERFAVWRESMNRFQKLVPQGSPMSAMGNPFTLSSLSNCTVVAPPEDTMSSIIATGGHMANLYKRRAGVGCDISTLRPYKAAVNNSALSSTGAYSFANHYSGVTRMVGQCLHEDTRVLTAFGLKKIKDVHVGEDVWTAEGWREIVGKPTNRKKLLEIRTKSGKRIRCSADHVLHTMDGEKRAGSLSKGDNITQMLGAGLLGQQIRLQKYEHEPSFYNNSNRLNKNVTQPEYLTTALAYAVGQMYGDGHVDRETYAITVAMSNDWPDVQQKYAECIAQCYNVEVSDKPHGGGCSRSRISSALIVGHLHQNDLLKEKADRIVVPESIFRSSCDIQGAFVSGFFDADGTVLLGKKCYRMVSISEEFVLGIQTILAANGIASRIHTDHRTAVGQENWSTIYAVTINGKLSQERFEAFCADSVKVSTNAPAMQATPKKTDGTRTIYNAGHLGTKSRRHTCIMDDRQHLSLMTVHRVAEEVGFSEPLVLLEDTVTSIEPFGDQEHTVYDLSLDSVHLFFADALYVHNSGRRGALMQTINIKHPDADRFITMKLDLTFCTGANVSIRVNDEFMNAVDADADFDMVWPCDTNVDDYLKENEGQWITLPEERKTFPNSQGVMVESIIALASQIYIPSHKSRKSKVVVRRVKARELWDLICDTARRTAEPGILFWDNYTKNLPAHFYPGFESTSTNPCSEILLSNFDSCRLLSMNLTSFIKQRFTETAAFDFESFDHYTRLAMQAMDNIVDLEIEALAKIKAACDDSSEIWLWDQMINAATKGRRTGLGAHALGDTLAQLCIRYDTQEAVDMTVSIYEAFKLSAYDSSCDMAVQRGAFPGWSYDIDLKCAFINRLPDELLKKMSETGRRNISLLTLAPTGSVSICCQTSSGLEPVFKNFYLRRRKINLSDINSRVDFVDGNGDSWQEYPIFHHNVGRYLNGVNLSSKIDEILANTPKQEINQALNALLPDYFVTAEGIDPMMRVELQAAITRHLDHGSSSTLNLPKGTETSTIQAIYHRAWKAGLKGVTVYVDGSRSGVLISASDKPDTANDIVESRSPKRPDTLNCDIHHATVDGQKWTILVGLMGSKPFEVFGGLSENIELPRKYTHARIVKRKCTKANAKGRLSCYDLVIGEDDAAFTVKDVAVTFNDGNNAASTRLISMSLRHGVAPNFVAEQLGRDKDSQFHSFSRVMARVLKKYVVDGTAAGEKCEVCGAKMVFQDSCMICLGCGASPKCG